MPSPPPRTSPSPDHPTEQAQAEESTPTSTSTPTPTIPMTTAANADVDAARVQMRKIEALETKIAVLKAELDTNRAKEDVLRGLLKTPTPDLTVQNHISLLHEYNRIRDIGTGLLGIIAENRGVRVRDLGDEFGVGEGD